jgi:osmotically-inducible protein OsmY
MTPTIAKHFGAATVAALLFMALPAVAEQPKVNDITPALVQAGAHVDNLRAVEIGGIVVLRGRTADQVAAVQVATLAQGLGYARVANLIQITQPVDDIAIERLAERQLGLSRGLEGCKFHIDSENGVVQLNGTVQYELQKDMAVRLVRSIDGVRSVQSTLQK